MKKLAKTYRKMITAPTMYVEDIEAIYEALEDLGARTPTDKVLASLGLAGKPPKISIPDYQAETYELEGVEELKALRTDPRRIRIELRAPHVWVDLRAGVVEVTAVEDTFDVQTTSHRIEEHVARTRPRGLRGFFGRLSFWTTACTVPTALLLERELHRPWIGMIPAALFFVTFVASPWSRISVKPRPVRSFWVRNRERFAVALVSAVSGGVIGYAVRIAPIPQPSTAPATTSSIAPP